MNRTVGRTIAVGVCGFALLAALVLVFVGARVEASSEAAKENERHCVATVGDSRGEKPKTECFSSFRVAIREATDGRVTDAPEDSSRLADDQGLQKKIFAPAPASARGSGEPHGNDTVGRGNVLSVEYEHVGQRGNTLTYRIKGHPCDRDPGLEAAVPYVGNEWNDEISSYVGAGRCQVKHYAHSKYRGRSTKLRQQDNRMGIFNDETSSIKWG